MEIVSYKFALFSILTVFIFYLLNPKHRIIFLVILSCLFIATYSFSLLIYILLYSLLNYYIGLKIPESKHKVLLFRTGVFLNLSQLILLKYSSFAIDPLLHLFNSNIHLSKLSGFLIPIGISYFTLQGIGYLINIKMGWEKPERNLFNFVLYITFYPKFLSGPIERSNHFLTQITDLGSFKRQNAIEGFRLILLGLIKKNIIANQLSLIVNPVYQDINSHDGGILMFVILIQPLYIYFDFSGYTDIARGIARSYGITLLPNFDRPFFSENVTTFWKRFHMSLAFWFNEYVFKQLNFRLRKWKTSASVFAVFVTWILFGIWHGAGWNFMVLGFLQALAINFEYFTKRKRQAIFSKIPALLGKWIGRIVTYIFYGASLVFFFSPNLKSTLQYFDRLKILNITLPISRTLISDHRVEIFSYSIAFVILIIFLIIEWISCDMKNKYEKIEILWTGTQFKFQFLRFVIYYLALLLMLFFGGMQTEFIYLQF
jgi:alginate O-acetyltransferase complex protein AlgI